MYSLNHCNLILHVSHSKEMKWDFYQCNCKLLATTATVVTYILFMQVNYY